MEKSVLDRRLAQMEAEGTRFRNGVHVGDEITGQQLVDRYDAVVLAIGATVARDLPVPGRELRGVYQAMEYLPQGNRARARPVGARPDPRRPASTSSSSAAATPAPTASAPRTARAPAR